jgi:sulfite exporter TauE/SafE
MNIFLVFLTGLTTGGLSCLAVQGGLLASVIANQQETANQRSQWAAIAMFLTSKLAIHTLFGALLGWLGASISLSLEVKLAFQLFTALFMLGTALNLLAIHPIFRYLAFQPPAFIRRFLRGSTHSTTLFAPALLGLLTIFIPCGITQAMEVVAINSASPWQGTLTMFFFVLGTIPLFAMLGFMTTQITHTWHHAFTKVAAALLIAMAAYTINGVLVVVGSPITANSITRPISYFFSSERFAQTPPPTVTNGVQKITINVLNSGYSPDYLRVAKDIPVELTLVTNQTYSCAVAFIFKEFKIKTFLEPTGQQTFTFTPTKPGTFTFTCSMGMYTGTLEVI